ncbi:alpha/beta fold hydrolase [Streptomyces cadmiisoli]|uniref:Alpha/beta hydrolase n=1 Tax=Streptomyces cadmiisoli TaxID=2184053 RepID=A0A2Z4J862_9ACTN|nr:alpha/beta fold hydrolase [Streptomyces cadmiisoli]AWW41334.1 alpha/beta hydrolase [Streptomyces cadmiisoli]
MTAPPTLLLVHGAWHGGWCWDRLRAAMEAEGVDTRTVDLPSAGGLGGIAEDTRVVREALAAMAGPVVVVAHSYGGIPAGQAVADAPDVVRVVYLAAFQLDVGESLLGFYGAPVPPASHEVEAVPGDPVDLFYADVPRTVAEEAAARLVPQSAKAFSDVVERAGWHHVPSTYIVCEHDRAIPVQSQETLAARADEVHRMATSHSPFLSAPAELAALLSKIAREIPA